MKFLGSSSESPASPTNMNAPSPARSFLFPRELFRHYVRDVLDFFQNAFFKLLQSARQRLRSAARMASPVDSKAPSEADGPLKPRMMHLKTKEECRLGNETIQVWTVELPSKHAEGILK